MALYRSLRMYRTSSRQLHGEKPRVQQGLWSCKFGSHHMLKIESCKFMIMMSCPVLLYGRPRGWSSSPGRVKNFLFSASCIPALQPTQPHIQWVLGALSPGVKRQGREADHSPPTRAEVKKMWIYTSTPPYAFMAYLLPLRVLLYDALSEILCTDSNIKYFATSLLLLLMLVSYFSKLFYQGDFAQLYTVYLQQWMQQTAAFSQWNVLKLIHQIGISFITNIVPILGLT
jgi:hypothetical protein